MKTGGLVILAILLTGCQEEREMVREVPTGYQGRARLNPYLAAERYLDEKGLEVESSRDWTDDDGETSLLFMPASFLETRGMAMRLLEWIAEGGTVVMTISGGEADRNDFTTFSPGDPPVREEEPGLDEFLGTLGIEVKERGDVTWVEGDRGNEGALARPWELSRTGDQFGGQALEFEGNVVLSVADGWNWIPEVGEGSRMVGTYYGEGEVIVLAHARPLRNPYLARADHADFLELLARNYGTGKTVFLYGSSTSFFGLIWREGWMAVVGGLLALLCWLWMRVPRFGPVLRDLEVKRKPYGDALITSARFLWRTGHLNALLDPLRRRMAAEGDKGPGSPETAVGRAKAGPAENRTPKDPGQILKLVQRIQQSLRS